MGFARSDAGVVLQLDGDEQRILSDLLYGVLEVLADDGRAPGDPVLQRWFPTAYPDDPAAAAEFRRFTADDLTRAKRDSAVTALETLDDPGADGERLLPPETALSWLASLNDIRMALGVRLGLVAAPGEDPLDPDELDPEDPVAVLYDWLTWLQETLVRSMP
jgi:hypothetical protein